MQVYVGNLPAEFSDAELKTLFEPFGTVRSATIGDEKGYGFVEMPVKSEARKAVDELRGKELEKGKPLRVRVLKPGDDFHARAQAVQGGSPKGGSQFRDAGHRAGGAMMRRSGKRGG